MFQVILIAASVALSIFYEIIVDDVLDLTRKLHLNKIKNGLTNFLDQPIILKKLDG
jgi:hypothetical protein